MNTKPVEAMDIFVVGGSGLVGQNIIRRCHEEQWNTLGTYHSDKVEDTAFQLDKTDNEEASDLISEHDPDVVIDTAAYHTVDECENRRQTAFDVNALGTRNVAMAANETDAHFIYLSTDYVFAGKPGEAPYSESDSVAPLNYYAESKYAGEQAAKIPTNSTVLRPSVIYGLANDNFATWALGELEAGNEITIVDDQVSAPTYAPDIARACVRIAEQGVTGLYHSTGPNSLSRFNFTRKIADVHGHDTALVQPISTEEFGQEAPRPEDSTLDSTRLYESIDYDFRTPETALRAMKGE